MIRNKKIKSLLSFILSIVMIMSTMLPTATAFGVNGNEKKASTRNYQEFPDGSIDNPLYPGEGATFLEKEAKWINDSSTIAEITLKQKGVPKYQGTDFIVIGDVSGSMGQGSPAKYTQLRTAVDDFVDIMYTPNEGQSRSDHRISMLLFGDSNTDASGGAREANNDSAIRIALTKANMDSADISGFADQSKKDAMLVAAKNIPYADGRTDFTSAFNLTKKMVENRGQSERPLTILFMSDGEPNPGNPSYQTINQLKKDGIDVYGIGLGLNNVGETNIKKISSNTDPDTGTFDDTKPFYYSVKGNDSTALKTVYKNIAANSKIAGSKATVTETIGDNFELVTSGYPGVSEPTTYRERSNGTTENLNDTVTKESSNRVLKWQRGDITRENSVMKYFVKIKDNTPVNNLYPVGTNKGSFIEYDNFRDVGVKKYFGLPSIAYPGGQIQIFPYLVDDNGKALGSIGGINVPEDEKGSVAMKLFDPNNPLYLKYNGAEFLQFNQNYTVDPSSQPGNIITYEGNTFQIHDNFKNAENYFISTANSSVRHYVGYTEAKDVNYSIKHIYKDENGKEISALTKVDNKSDIVGSTVNATKKDVAGYKFVNATPSNSIKLTADPNNNVITMNYTVDTGYKGDEYKGKVNYFLEGTTNKVPGISKNPDTFKGYPGQEIDIPYPSVLGYVSLASNPSKIKLDYTPGSEVVQDVYYNVDKSSKDYSGKIKYKLKGTNDDVPGLAGDNPKVVNGYPGEVISVDNPSVPGFKVLDGTSKANIELSKDPNDPHSAETVVYYEYDSASRDFKGEISYFLKDTKNPVTDLETVLSGYNSTTGILGVSGARGASLSIDKPKVPTQGYKPVDSSSESIVLPTIITDIAKKTIFYEIDKDQKFEYKVNYKYKSDGSLIPGMTENPKVARGYRGEVVTVAHPSVAGYKPVSGSLTSYEVTINNNQEIDVLYEVDKDQKFDYTVKHVNEKGRKIHEPDTGKLAVEETLKGETKTITGYKYKSAAPSDSIKIKAAGSNEIVMTYEVDKSQTFDYKVTYVNESSAQIAATETGKLPVESDLIAEQKAIPGYIFKEAKPSNKIEIATGTNEIVMIYEVDKSKGFPVEAKYIDTDGNEISNPVTDSLAIESEFTATEKIIPGYKFKEAKPSNKITITAAGPNNIEMIYEVDSNQKFDYEITHINEAGKEIAPKDTGKLPVNSKLTAIEKAIPGYKYKSADPNKTIDISTGSNKIVVTYEVDKNQLFDYEIRYYMDGSTLPALGVDTFLTDYNKATGKIVGKGYLGQDISVTIPTGAQLNNGYGPVSTNPSEVLTNGNFKTTIDKNKNIVTVNYGIDKDVKLDYKINYYLLDDKKSEVKNIDSVLTKNSANNEAYATKEFTGKGHLGEKITIQQPNISGLGSEYTNYKVQTGLPTEMTLKAGVNEIDIYYVRDKNATVDYSISYVDKGGNPIKDLAEKTQVQDIAGTGRIDSKKVVPQPKLEGYTVVSGQPTMMTIKEDPADNNEIIVYEKQSYKYEIRYLEVGSNNPIKLSPNKEEGTAEYGEKIIAANAHDDLPLGGPADYRIADSAQAKDLIVTADETKNILNIYYIPEKVDITVSFYLKGTTTKIHKDVTFEHIISGGKIGIGQEYSGTSILTAAKAIWGGNAVIPAYYKLQDGANKVKVTSSGMNISLFFRR